MSQKKFGAFGGVFTPSILTILGVIMYLRLGWVIGHAGMIGTILIIVVAHVISVSTGLSVSSIATDKKVGAGGIYYILSRSMGIPIGGAIGIALYVGTALSIALYLIGFAESFNLYFGLDTGINGLRMTGAIALIALTSIALISTAVAIKTQYIILVAIIISLIAIFFGVSNYVPETVQNFSTEGSLSLEVVFAVFFPAVTGFTAGIAMSGDLKDPKKSIPIGTLAAVAVGFLVYIGLTVFIAYRVDAETLRSDYNVLMKIALFAPAVVAGIWGATLSSALGGILGGPRILQAMSIDKITPKIFGVGRGKENEPVNALFLVFGIAFAGVMIGELDAIASIVSMFYLSAYGFINLSFFLESWANPDFQPTFKVKRWIGMLGFVACFGVMFKLNAGAMFGAIAIIMGIYFWLQRKQIMLSSGDVWQSVWENIVAKGLKKLEGKDVVKANWNPNIILFSGDTEDRPHLLRLSKTVAGRTGVVTNFNLIQKNDSVFQSKTEQIIQSEKLKELGIFGRRVEVENIYRGVENIASTFGFSGIDPNTVMMGWPKNISNEEEYLEMTRKLIHLDYNLLYLDYDKLAKFGNYKTIDVWWRETDNNNAEMMLNIVRFINQTRDWSNCKIRILFVNHNNTDNSLVKSKITNLVDELRITAEIKIINNGVEQKSFYEIIKNQSLKTDLVLLGIPNVAIEKQAEFIIKTNYLFETIGSTLLVKASNNFNAIELDFSLGKQVSKEKTIELKELPDSSIAVVKDLVYGYDDHLSSTTKLIAEPALETISSFYYQLLSEVQREFSKTATRLETKSTISSITPVLYDFLEEVRKISEKFKTDNLSSLELTFNLGINKFIDTRKKYIENATPKIKIENEGKSKTIRWKATVHHYYNTKLLLNTQFSLYNFGVSNFTMLTKLSEKISNYITCYIENIAVSKTDRATSLLNLESDVEQLIEGLILSSTQMTNGVINELKNYERNLCISLVSELENPKRKKRQVLNKKDIAQYESNVTGYASDWYRNQLLAHVQAEANIDMIKASLMVFDINERIKNSIKTNVMNPQEDRVKTIFEITRSLHQFISENPNDWRSKITIDTKELDLLAENVTRVSFEKLIEDEEDKMNAFFQNTSSTVVDLLSNDSYNDLIKVQNEEVQTIPVDISTIKDYIIQSKYMSPLQDSLQELETHYNENSEKIYYAAGLLKHLIEDQDAEDNQAHYLEVLKEVQLRIDGCKDEIDITKSTLEQELNANTHNTLTDLNIGAIVASVDNYSHAIQQPLIKSKFDLWVDKQKEKVKSKYHKVVDFVVQRKQEIDTLKFDQKHDKYLNKINQTSDFLSSFSLSSALEEAIPFYYKKLFTGSHIGNAFNRKKEAQIANDTINKIDSGISGALMVIGQAFSGKTFFTEHIANAISEGSKYYVNPPFKQRFEVNDMHQAFQKTFNQSGSSEAILSRLEPHAILIFNDLEEWYLKSSNGHLVINYLSKLIEQFGAKHYFLLNANIFSFDVIRKTTSLEKSLLSTIIMSPTNELDMKKIILNRHRTAGVDMILETDYLSNSKKADKLFSTIHSISHGNIGIALNLWLKGFGLTVDNVLTMKRQINLRFPKIDDPEWKLLLYHFIIHHNLTTTHIQMLFGSENEWIQSVLKEMEKSGLVIRQSNRVFKLNDTAKNYIENWLQELKILND